MKPNQYSRHDSVKVKARANYLCELCGSDQMVQAHLPVETTPIGGMGYVFVLSTTGGNILMYHVGCFS